MKKFDFKTRMQVGWLKTTIFGAVAVMLVAPVAGNLNEETAEKTENPIISMLSSISFGTKTKVMINGDVVALAPSEEAAEEAYKAARLAYNANGVKILDVDVTYAQVDKEKDAKAIKGKKLLRNEKLEQAILESFDKYSEKGKALAYTMRIDDYTVTVNDMEDLIDMLEKAQGQYDENDAFKVGLEQPASSNVAMYEVAVTAQTTALGEADADEKGEDDTAEVSSGEQNSEEISSEESTSEESATPEAEPEESAAEGEDTAVLPIAEKKMKALTGAESEESGSEESSDDGTQEEASEEQTSEEPVSEEVTTEELSEQAANDGVKYVGFSEKIQVTETYVNKDQIKDKNTAYDEITEKNSEASIYVVEPGDCLSIIAEKNNMTVDEIKELNPGIESDDNLYYDDRLNITVPKAAVQILVQKQETYKESYYEDVVYEDDDSMYIGEAEVVQEGQCGTHTVTDLVTYKDDVEYSREELQETVEVAAVAQIVRRGTKSKPTYMYPVTNWNVTSTFGSRWGRLHAGIDVGVPIGTTVRASRGGQVITAGWVGGYGNCVIIDHGDGVSTRYGHLNEVTVSVGQYVDQGQQIALSGNTGRSTGPHLHFEIRINGEAVDPAPYLSGEN